MKKGGVYILIIAAFFIEQASVSAQDHFVQYLEGKIYIDGSESHLKQFDIVEIRPNSTIRFTKATDILVAVLDDGSNIVYKPTKKRGNNKSESLLTSIARKALFPVRKPTSSRDVFPSLVEFLSENRVVVLDGNIAFPSLNYTDTLYIRENKQFKMMTRDTINDLYKLKVKAIDEHSLPLFILDRKDIKPIMDIYATHTESDLLRNEIRVLIAAFKDQKLGETQRNELILGYIQINYGFLPEQQLEYLIESVVKE